MLRATQKRRMGHRASRDGDLFGSLLRRRLREADGQDAILDVGFDGVALYPARSIILTRRKAGF